MSNALVVMQSQWEKDPNNATVIYINTFGRNDYMKAFLGYCELKNPDLCRKDSEAAINELHYIISNFAYNGFDSDFYKAIKAVKIGKFSDFAEFKSREASFGEQILSNADAGLYVIDNDWNISDVLYTKDFPTAFHEIRFLMQAINSSQPEETRFSDDDIFLFYSKKYPPAKTDFTYNSIPAQIPGQMQFFDVNPVFEQSGPER